MNGALLHKYLQGKCTPEEEAAVLEYLAQEQPDALHRYMREVEATAPGEAPAHFSASLLEDIHQEITARRHPRRLWLQGGWRVAAGLLLLVSVPAILFWSLKQRKQAPGEQWLSVSNEGREVKKVHMPDGTQIWLNAQSAIAYRERDYSKGLREVRVNGEAFFEVAGDPHKPFRVQAGKVTTTVLGTAFNIEHYAHESDVRVTLVQGKVEVAANAEQYILSPGQMMSYNVQAQSMEVRSTAAARTREWVSGRLVFNDVALADVLKRLEYTYNIRIACNRPSLLEGKRITGTYDRGAPADVLRRVLFIHGLHYEQQPGQFLIKP